MLGTTHFVNALITTQGLPPSIHIIRLCGPATQSLPPCSDLPLHLLEVCICMYVCIHSHAYVLILIYPSIYLPT